MGYVGRGFMAQEVHIPNMLSLDDCELVLLAEARPRLGAMVQRSLGVPRLHPSHGDVAEREGFEPSVRIVIHTRGFQPRSIGRLGHLSENMLSRSRRRVNDMALCAAAACTRGGNRIP